MRSLKLRARRQINGSSDAHLPPIFGPVLSCQILNVALLRFRLRAFRSGQICTKSAAASKPFIWLRALSVLVFTLAAGFAAPGDVHAADWIIKDGSQGKDRPMNLDISLATRYYSIGPMVNFAIPIVPDGFIGPINDSFDLEFGVQLMYRWNSCAGAALIGFRGNCGSGFGILPLAGVRWKFHLTPEWTVFAQTKIGARIGTGYVNTTFAYEGGLGAYWQFSDDLWLRFDVGTVLGVGLSIVL